MYQEIVVRVAQRKGGKPTLAWLRCLSRQTGWGKTGNSCVRNKVSVSVVVSSLENPGSAVDLDESVRNWNDFLLSQEFFLLHKENWRWSDNDDIILLPCYMNGQLLNATGYSSRLKLIHDPEEHWSPPQTGLPQLDGIHHCIHDQNKLKMNQVKYRSKWAISNLFYPALWLTFARNCPGLLIMSINEPFKGTLTHTHSLNMSSSGSPNPTLSPPLKVPVKPCGSEQPWRRQWRLGRADSLQGHAERLSWV